MVDLSGSGKSAAKSIHDVDCEELSNRLAQEKREPWETRFREAVYTVRYNVTRNY